MTLSVMSKKVIISSILLLFFTSVFGQRDTTKRNSLFAIKTNPVLLAFNAFSVEYIGSITVEKGFSGRHSFQITGTIDKSRRFKSTSWFLTPEYKFFLNRKKNFDGFYAGVYARYQHRTDLDLYSYGSDGSTYITKNYRNYGWGIISGFQTYIKKRLIIDFLLGAGGMIYTRRVSVPSNYTGSGAMDTADSGYPSIHPSGRILINIGYKF